MIFSFAGTTGLYVQKSFLCENDQASHLLICFTCVGCTVMLPIFAIFKLLFVNSCFKNELW